MNSRGRISRSTRSSASTARPCEGRYSWVTLSITIPLSAVAALGRKVLAALSIHGWLQDAWLIMPSSFRRRIARCGECSVLDPGGLVREKLFDQRFDVDHAAIASLLHGAGGYFLEPVVPARCSVRQSSLKSITAGNSQTID